MMRKLRNADSGDKQFILFRSKWHPKETRQISGKDSSSWSGDSAANNLAAA
jgi:hypothetical protein